MSAQHESIQIAEAEPADFDTFKRLNYEWIERYFEVEDSDRRMLEAPQETVIDKGGVILMAFYEGTAVGTCALLRTNDSTFELAKMAVDDSAKGKGIGWLLGEAALNTARNLGASRVFLDSNTKLTPAINLYRKLGFRQFDAEPSPYARCNIQMEVLL